MGNLACAIREQTYDDVCCVGAGYNSMRAMVYWASPELAKMPFELVDEAESLTRSTPAVGVLLYCSFLSLYMMLHALCQQ